MLSNPIRKAAWLAVAITLVSQLNACGGGGGGGTSASAEALDAKYDYTGELGVSYTGDVPTLRVWAPTAKSVALKLYTNSTASSPAQTVTMTFDDTTGVWSATGDSSWTGMFYLYNVKGNSTYNVTDPYSVSLSTDSKRSQIINLDASDWKPADWDDLGTAAEPKPTLTSFSDIVIYELHIRDFSINDATVLQSTDRGKFTAFADADSNGIKHLKALKSAGFTHIHLLPAFDFARLTEDESARTEPTIPANTSGASMVAANAVTLAASTDGFNWGYDPWHYGVPEGSYSTDPDGAQRVLEFREMVQAINRMGLRVIMDVVYNHTFASGSNTESVFDKIVPGYYYLLDANGQPYTTICCPETASEHEMMEKLMIDTLVRWAKEYKVDGFRFDLMGSHSKQNLLNIRAALDQLTVDTDGVDGSKIFLYGEGWEFGETANNALFENAAQINMAGTGIGTFNDRLRDAVRGGSPFSGYTVQGFSNANDYSTDTLLYYADIVRLGLAGNLATFSLTDKTGSVVTGADMEYNGEKPAGYAVKPLDSINYVGAHDNETLFDNTQIKAANQNYTFGSEAATYTTTATIDERIRMHVLAESIVALSQGIPFFHAGDEILRSKSLDRNSYNSGDWFNKLDFSYAGNNWAVGRPPDTNANSTDNSSHYTTMDKLLTNNALKVTPTQIESALAQFEEYIKIRTGSKLFRLEDATDIEDRITFYNTGTAQTPGLIVMNLEDDPTVNAAITDLDPAYKRIVVVINASGAQLTYTNPSGPWAGKTIEPHPCLADSSDAVTKTISYSSGTYTVPARTSAVFVEIQDSALAACD